MFLVIQNQGYKKNMMALESSICMFRNIAILVLLSQTSRFTVELTMTSIYTSNLVTSWRIFHLCYCAIKNPFWTGGSIGLHYLKSSSQLGSRY